MLLNIHEVSLKFWVTYENYQVIWLVHKKKLSAYIEKCNNYLTQSIYTKLLRCLDKHTHNDALKLPETLLTCKVISAIQP
jgi:hypothetical protein